jgi:hypothetical protein
MLLKLSLYHEDLFPSQGVGFGIASFNVFLNVTIKGTWKKRTVMGWGYRVGVCSLMYVLVIQTRPDIRKWSGPTL